MINGLTQEQFDHLPVTSLHYPCDTCGKGHDYGFLFLLRDIGDYILANGEIIAKESCTALYLCGDCRRAMTCKYASMEREQARQREQIASNEARWLQKVSGLTIQELAQQVGVSRQAYHKWLRGKTITPEHKARIKGLIDTYLQQEEPEREDDAYFAGGVIFVKKS